ncbi:MAG: metallophosphoesterase family protein [Ignavibacteriae bacterium]|nr:metallophosphoesterase family protein [Ignavibacteriota bacterium]
MRIFIFILLISIKIIGQNQSTKIDIIPQRIILNLTELPATELAVTWMTKDSVENSLIQISKAKPWADFVDSVFSYNAFSSSLNNGKSKNVFFHSVKISELLPDTKYVYRVGGDSIWSEWNQFKTSNNKNEEFEFTYFGDMQHDVKKFGSRVFRKAIQTSPNSSFWLFSGDLLDRAEFDYQWEEYFQATSFISSIMPAVFAAGNHEYADTIINGNETEILAELWKSHITQPSCSIKGLDETVFSFEFQGVRFIILNGNEKLEEQAKWLEQILENNNSIWTIVTIHQPIYSMGKNRDQRKTKNAFVSLFDKYNVDIVLQGHDHVYARTHKIKNDKIVNNSEHGTVYITSNSGSDSYSAKSLNSHLTVKHANSAQLFQVISIKKRNLQMCTYTATGELYDKFELTK